MTKHWKVENDEWQSAQRMSSLSAPASEVEASVVHFSYKNAETTFSWQASHSGWLRAFTIDLSEVGKIYIQPLFVGKDRDIVKHRLHDDVKYLIFDAMQNLSGATLTLGGDDGLVGVQNVCDKQNDSGTWQPGIDVLHDEHMTQVVIVAQLIVTQRLAFRPYGGSEAYYR